jgi:hypothetical protein
VHHRRSGRPLPAGKAAKAAVASQKAADPNQLSRWSIFVAERSAAVPACLTAAAQGNTASQHTVLCSIQPTHHTSACSPYLISSFCHPRQAASAGGSRLTCWTHGGRYSIARCAHCHLNRRSRPYRLRRCDSLSNPSCSQLLLLLLLCFCLPAAVKAASILS